MILLLSQGKIEEFGTHKELLATGGLYASMWMRQSHGYQEKDRNSKKINFS